MYFQGAFLFLNMNFVKFACQYKLVSMKLSHEVYSEVDRIYITVCEFLMRLPFRSI